MKQAQRLNHAASHADRHGKYGQTSANPIEQLVEKQRHDNVACIRDEVGSIALAQPACGQSMLCADDHYK